jgi:hypothetical protein
MISLSYVSNSPLPTPVVLHALKLKVALVVVDAIDEELTPG